MGDFEIRDRRHSAGPIERRDPQYASTNTVFISPGRPQIPDWDAYRAILAYQSQVYVWRCAQKVANDIARLPIRVGADPDNPGDYRKDGGLVNLLGPMPNKPNPQMSARTLIAYSIAMYLITGRFVCEIDRGGESAYQSTAGSPGRLNGAPLGLWPIPSHLIDPNPTDGGLDYFGSYTFRLRGLERRLEKEQVLYCWKPSLIDPRQPESVLQAARLDVDVAAMLDQYTAAFLRNNATPATMVTTEQFATPEDRDQFQEQFNGAYGGPKNAGRTAFLEAQSDAGEKGVAGMMDVKTLGLSQKDAQFKDQIEAKISAICVAFGTPLSILGDASGRTFSNADQEEFNYWQNQLSVISDIQDHLNLRLAPEFGSDVCWFDLTSVKALKPHRNLIAVDVATAVQNDIVTLPEAREYLGVPAANPDITAEDEQRARYASVGMSRMLAALPALIQARVLSEQDGRDLIGVTGKAPGRDPTPPQLVAVPPAPGQPVLPPGNAPAPPAGDKTAGGLQPQTPVKVTRTAEPATEPAGAPWELALLRARAQRADHLLGKQADAVHRWLSGKRGQALVRRGETGDVQLYDATFWAAEMRTWALDLYDTAASLATRGTQSPELAGWVVERAERLAGAVTRELAGVVADTYRAAVADMFDHQEVVDAVDDAVRQFTTSTVARIVDREPGIAYAEASSYAPPAHLSAVLAGLGAGELDIDAAIAALEEGAPNA